MTLRSMIALGCLAAAGCGGTWGPTPEQKLEGIGVGTIGSATVVTAEELREAGGSVLRAILGKVPNMKVTYTARCPSIAMRSSKNHRRNDSPSVYVDGTHVGDTCILETLEAREVDRVEVYPTGFTHRPGYRGSNGGLILVFLRRS
ncbi:MAG TPA: TonB-dependent receptor plug domain-containing protein [Longimicrobiales bacterium]|nr:TonB-dependent receptor plug domain-containing protein [Longimicrobiales bacterium]